MLTTSTRQIQSIQSIQQAIIGEKAHSPLLQEALDDAATFINASGKTTALNTQGNGRCLIYSLLASIIELRGSWWIASFINRLRYILTVHHDQIDEHWKNIQFNVKANYDWDDLVEPILAVASIYWKKYNRAEIGYYIDDETLNAEWHKPIMEVFLIKNLTTFTAFPRANDQHNKSIQIKCNDCPTGLSTTFEVCIMTIEGCHWRGLR